MSYNPRIHRSADPFSRNGLFFAVFTQWVCTLASTPPQVGHYRHQTEGIAPLGARHAGDTPATRRQPAPNAAKPPPAPTHRAKLAGRPPPTCTRSSISVSAVPECSNGASMASLISQSLNSHAARPTRHCTRPRQMSHVIPHCHFSSTPENVAIPTIYLYSVKHHQGNYVRKCLNP